MYVGMARISLALADAHSLKDKRMVIRRIKDRVRERVGVFVSEVQQGYECGVMVAGWNEIKQNDVIEAYEVIEEAAQL